jgi:hypothetical protein
MRGGWRPLSLRTPLGGKPLSISLYEREKLYPYSLSTPTQEELVIKRGV